MYTMHSHQQWSLLHIVAIVGLLLLCGVRIVVVIAGAATVLPLGGDARSYIAASQAILHGLPPIGANGAPFLPEAGPDIPVYLYPPFLALMIVPLAVLPYPLSLYLWLILVVAMTALLIPMLRHLVGWGAATCGVLFFLPTWESLWLGQINAMVAVILTLALISLGQRKNGVPGIALALGALLKITPALSFLVLVIHRRWRSVGVATITALGVIALSLPVVSLDVWYRGSLYALTSTWTSPLLLSWTALLRNQTGVIGSVGPVALSTLMLVVTAKRSMHTPLHLGLAATYLLPLLISGIIWHYTALLALPALSVLWQHNRRGRMIALVTWASISLIGGILQPIMLTLCWWVCCWPGLLEPPAATSPLTQQ